MYLIKFWHDKLPVSPSTNLTRAKLFLSLLTFGLIPPILSGGKTKENSAIVVSIKLHDDFECLIATIETEELCETSIGDISK